MNRIKNGPVPPSPKSFGRLRIVILLGTASGFGNTRDLLIHTSDSGSWRKLTRPNMENRGLRLQDESGLRLSDAWYF